MKKKEDNLMWQWNWLNRTALVVLVTFVTSTISPYYAMADDAGWWYIGGTQIGALNINPAVPFINVPQQVPPNCSVKTQKPVNIHSGEEMYSCVDFSIPGRGMDLMISHEYRSGYQANTSYGYGWSINYYERIQPLSDGNVNLLRGAGYKYKFTAAGSGAYLPPPGIFETLVQNGNGTWTLTKANGTKHNYTINGVLSTIVDRNGNTITFTYDAGGVLPTTGSAAAWIIAPAYAATTVVNFDYRLVQITDTLGRNVNLNYNSAGRLTSMTDPFGRTVSYTYSSYSTNLLTITKPATAQFPSGVTKTFSYDAGGNLATITDANSHTFVTNYYDSADRVYLQTLGSGNMTFNYSVPGKTTLTDRVGNVTTYTFNTTGNPTFVQQFTRGLRAGEPSSYQTVYTYNTDMLMTSVTYPKGNGVIYTYDEYNANRLARGNLLQVRRKSSMAAANNDTNDIVINITYEPNFNFLKTITDANGNVITLIYDYELSIGDPRYGTKGNLVTATFPTVNAQTPTLNFTYDAYGRLTEFSDAKGHITQYAYNAANGQLATISRDPAGINAVTQLTYDAFINLDTVTDPLSNVTDYNFDALGWLNQVTDARGVITKYTRDANGNVTKVERQANAGATVWQTWQMAYNNRNDLTALTDPLNRVTTYTYNNNEDLASVMDANNNITTYQYDERRLPFTVTDASSPAGVTRYDYDINGNQSKITDANGNATNYAYDNFDRLTTETFADTRTNVYTYDKNSNVLTRTNPATQQIQYAYDALNRLTAQSYPSDSTMNITYGYDVGSLLTSAVNGYSSNAFTYDNLNRVLTNTQTLNGTNYTVNYAYNDLNQTGVTYPSSKAVTYAYNANNQLSSLSVGGTALMNLTYDTLSRRTQKDLTGTATKQAIYTWDIADQLTTLENKIAGGATISKHDYTYDNVSNRLTHAITAAVNKSYTYTYNNIYELTGVSGSETSSFAYDKLGNRTTANGIPYTSNNLNQYTAVNSVTHTYDNNGNLTGDGTNSYSYDVESRLTSFSKSGITAGYTYDAFNRRVSKTVNGTTIYYVYDADDIIEERSSAGALNADWVHGDQIDEPLTMTRGGTTYYYTRDALGSVRELTNSAGTVQETYTYNSYGQLSAAPTINNPFTFTGREYDPESGNFYYRARHYSPTIGRFLQRDPIGYWDSNNLYQYVFNSPTNFIDPTGEEGLLLLGGGLGIILLAILIYSPKFVQTQTCPPTRIEIPDWITVWIAIGHPLIGPLLGIPPVLLAKSKKDKDTRNNKKKNKGERTSDDVEDLQDKLEGILDTFGKIGQRAGKTKQNIKEWLKKKMRDHSN